MARGRAWERWTAALWIATTGSMLACLWMALLYAPEEKIMGAAQRIFYFHLPTVFVTYTAVVLLLVGSLGYLWTRDARWDHLSRAATETGALFCAIVLVTGAIWARPAWGIWWSWEARVTTTLILWLLLVAILLVRSYAPDRETAARMASVLGIVAALDIPIIHKAVEWWRGHHPVVFSPGKRGGLEPEMVRTLGAATVVFFLLFAVLVLLRHRLLALEERAAALTERMAPR
jgi:heme exporter protein C